MTQPYLSHRRWLLHAQAVSAAPAASFKSICRTDDLESFTPESPPTRKLPQNGCYVRVGDYPPGTRIYSSDHLW